MFKICGLHDDSTKEYNDSEENSSDILCLMTFTEPWQCFGCVENCLPATKNWTGKKHLIRTLILLMILLTLAVQLIVKKRPYHSAINTIGKICNK